MKAPYRAVHYDKESSSLVLLDQTLIPWEEKYIHLRHSSEIAEAIKSLRVRGAPMIGVAAAYGFVVSVSNGEEPEHVYNLLKNTRPTAVNLFKALQRVYEGYKESGLEGAIKAAELIEKEEEQRSYAMAQHGAEYLEKLFREKGKRLILITHCNTGALAAPGIGTAFGVIVESYNRGLVELVLVDKTDPLQQGARLTMWELSKFGVPAVLLPDTATAFAVRNYSVDIAIVGADRIAMNGDFANKIGTYQLSLSIRANGGKFMVVAPTSTWDKNISSGDEIPIEIRNAEEVLWYRGRRLPVEEDRVWNPAFDVTPHHLVDVYVSEKGSWLSPGEFEIE